MSPLSKSMVIVIRVGLSFVIIVIIIIIMW